MGKIGLGVITCNRLDFFRQCILSVPDLDFIVVVNDGNPYPSDAIPSKVIQLIQHKKNMGIARTKNDALKAMLKNNCEHLFLIEDDISIKRQIVIEKYIQASSKSGIGHFNYGYHGPVNRDEDGKSKFRKLIKYDNDTDVVFNYKLTGAFSYFRDYVLKDVGFMDERYKNVLEHVDHTYRIIKAGYHPPFFWFADIANSEGYLLESDPDLKDSLNRPYSFSYKFRVFIYNKYFKWKFGSFPGHISDCSEETFLKIINNLKLNYGE